MNNDRTISLKVTVITVTYNDITLLKKTLGSLLSLSPKNLFEFIVIDGNSTDGTSSYLSDLEEDRLTWISEPDNGLYDAMNKGISMAKGEWLWFINSGDYIQGNIIDPSWLDTQYPFILLPLFDNGNPFQKHYPPWQIPYCHQGILFKRDESIKYNPELTIAADYKYILDYMKVYDCEINSLPIYDTGGKIIADLNGANRHNRLERDLQAFKVSLSHFGPCSNLLFFPALLIYQFTYSLLFRRSS